MIGEHYECDGQIDITEIIGEHPKPNAVVGEIKLGDCKHECVLLRTKRAKYCKCVKCGKRFRYDKGMFGMR